MKESVKVEKLFEDMRLFTCRSLGVLGFGCSHCKIPF